MLWPSHLGCLHVHTPRQPWCVLSASGRIDPAVSCGSVLFAACLDHCCFHPFAFAPWNCCFCSRRDFGRAAACTTLTRPFPQPCTLRAGTNSVPMHALSPCCYLPTLLSGTHYAAGALLPFLVIYQLNVRPHERTKMILSLCSGSVDWELLAATGVFPSLGTCKRHVPPS